LEAAVQRSDYYGRQIHNVRGFVITGNPAHLQDKAYLDIPYPDVSRLIEFLSDPSIRSVLHPAITGKVFPSDPGPALILPDALTACFRGLLIVVRLLAPAILMVGVLGFAVLAVFSIKGWVRSALLSRWPAPRRGRTRWRAGRWKFSGTGLSAVRPIGVDRRAD
jgi:hypothetical protein